jgi:hypothetical protein
VAGVAVSCRRMFHSVGYGDAVAGWRRGDGDGRTGLMATEVTAPTGLTSRRRPVRAQSSCASSLRGFRRPFSRVRCAVREWVVQCRGAVADHIAQRRTVAGMDAPWELAEQWRGMIPRRVVAWIRL